MPLYEYACDECGHRFERIQKYSDPPIDVCPKCGGAVKKQVSSPAFQFKGSGWYITDYARKTDSKDKSAAGESKASGESGDKSAQDAKGAGKDKPTEAPAKESKSNDSSSSEPSSSKPRTSKPQT